MSRITKINNYNDFTCKCKFFYCKDIYGEGWTGKEKYIISSDLTEYYLLKNYPEIMHVLSPYVYCSGKCGQIILKSLRNDEKFRKRMFKEVSVDDETEPSLIFLYALVDVEEEVGNKISIEAALNSVTPTQKERIQKYFFEQQTLEQIADGRSHKSISESITGGLSKMKRFFE